MIQDIKQIRARIEELQKQPFSVENAIELGNLWDCFYFSDENIKNTILDKKPDYFKIRGIE